MKRLQRFTHEQINEVDLNQNIVLRRRFPNNKMGVVDVLAKINGNEYCNIEMKMIDMLYFIFCSFVFSLFTVFLYS